MKRLIIAALSAMLLAVSFAAAPAADAATCKTWNSTWKVKEGSFFYSTATIKVRHSVCVNRRGYTSRWADATISLSDYAQKAGFVYKLSPMQHTQSDTTFDGWTAYGSYQVCLGFWKIQACPPAWGEFKVVHRVARYDNSTTVVKVDDYAVATNTWGKHFRAVRP